MTKRKFLNTSVKTTESVQENSYVLHVPRAHFSSDPSNTKHGAKPHQHMTGGQRRAPASTEPVKPEKGTSSSTDPAEGVQVEGCETHALTGGGGIWGLAGRLGPPP